MFSRKEEDPDEIVLGTVLSDRNRGRFYKLGRHDQEHHVTIWGRTGSGKSKLLQAIFLQHLKRGHGVGILDPHHDLSIDTLSYLVRDGFFRDDRALERLVYLDWGNGSYVPFNVLRAGGDPKAVALNALEAMMRVWPELRRAPTFQTLFLSATMALIENRLPLTFLYQLLTDGPFRERCLRQVSDPLVLQAFGTFEQTRVSVKDSGSTLRRAFLISFSDVARLTLGQPEYWVDHRKIMDTGESVIHNLGNIKDAETKRLIGALLLVQLEQAALSRTDTPASLRKPFTMLVDEWPSFSASDSTIGTMLAQTRKFGLRLVLAAQSTDQASGDALEGALENCRLNIVFGLGRDSAVDQSRWLTVLDPEAKRYDEATGRVRRISTGEQFEDMAQDLQSLSPQEAYVKLHTEAPEKLQTLRIADSIGIEGRQLDSVLSAYKGRYQRSTEDAQYAAHSVGGNVSPLHKPGPKPEMFATPDIGSVP
jgi:hypothetical protein